MSKPAVFMGVSSIKLAISTGYNEKSDLQNIIFITTMFDISMPSLSCMVKMAESIKAELVHQLLPAFFK